MYDREREQDITTARVDPTVAPPPCLLPFTDEANDVLKALESEIQKEKNRLKPYGMSAMLLRVEEITMRVSLIVALSCGAKKILAEHVQWARDYVWFYQKKMIDVFRNEIGKSELEAVADKLEKLIRERGEEGMTKFEMGRYCRSFRRLKMSEVKEVLERLEQFHRVRFEAIKTEGRVRKAYVYVG